METSNINNTYNNHYPFALPPLPYAYGALEPFIDEKTMHLHHDRHLATYVKNLNDTLKDYPALHCWSLEQLLYYIDLVPLEIQTAVKNNGGGVYNHTMFFNGLTPNLQDNGVPTGSLLKFIELDFVSFDKFKEEFKKQALAVFGSGYTWLGATKNGKVHIVNTKNQDTILPDNIYPLALIDVWEHAYYLKHYNVRADYIDDWFKVLNMDLVEKKFEGFVG